MLTSNYCDNIITLSTVAYDCNDESSDHAMEIDSISLEDLQWSSAQRGTYNH